MCIQQTLEKSHDLTLKIRIFSKKPVKKHVKMYFVYNNIVNYLQTLKYCEKNTLKIDVKSFFQTVKKLKYTKSVRNVFVYNNVL